MQEIGLLDMSVNMLSTLNLEIMRSTAAVLLSEHIIATAQLNEIFSRGESVSLHTFNAAKQSSADSAAKQTSGVLRSKASSDTSIRIGTW